MTPATSHQITIFNSAYVFLGRTEVNVPRTFLPLRQVTRIQYSKKKFGGGERFQTGRYKVPPPWPHLHASLKPLTRHRAASRVMLSTTIGTVSCTRTSRNFISSEKSSCGLSLPAGASRNPDRLGKLLTTLFRDPRTAQSCTTLIIEQKIQRAKRTLRFQIS